MTSEWYPAISSEVDQTSEMRVLVILISTAIPSNVKLILRASTLSLSRKQRKKDHFIKIKKNLEKK